MQANAIGWAATLTIAGLAVGDAACAESTSVPADSARAYGPAVVGNDGTVEVWRLPALAKEDTFGVKLRYELREITIEGDRVTLREILRRAQEGEKRRRHRVEDVQYTQNVRAVVIGSRTGDQRRRIFEERSRIYLRPPNQQVTVSLGNREYGDQDETENIDVEATHELYDALDFVQAPFYLEDIDAYRYEIADRQVFPDRVVYAVAFEPRSEFAVEPSGTFWIDAAEFVVVHEEMEFKNNPAPLFIRSIDKLVREHRMIDGHLVPTRIQARVDLRMSWALGFKAVEVEATYTDFEFNVGLDDAIFDPQ